MPILKDILLIFGLAIAVLLLCHRLQVATIVGFLVTGILAGTAAPSQGSLLLLVAKGCQIRVNDLPA